MSAVPWASWTVPALLSPTPCAAHRTEDAGSPTGCPTVYNGPRSGSPSAQLVTATLEAMYQSQPNEEVDPAAAVAARAVEECDRALARHRAALEAGADLHLVTGRTGHDSGRDRVVASCAPRRHREPGDRRAAGQSARPHAPPGSWQASAMLPKQHEQWILR